MQRTFLLHRKRMGILPERQSIAIRDHRGEALFFRDPDGHLLEVVTPGVWSIY